VRQGEEKSKTCAAGSRDAIWVNIRFGAREFYHSNALRLCAVMHRRPMNLPIPAAPALHDMSSSKAASNA
jgi:hypothetical protein